MLLKKISTVVFALILIVHFNACENKDNTEVFWHITECKDPWWAENVDLTTIDYRELMTIYLLTKDIIVEDHFLDQNAEADDETCTGCACKTEFRIRAVIMDDDLEAALALGFTEE